MLPIILKLGLEFPRVFEVQTRPHDLKKTAHDVIRIDRQYGICRRNAGDAAEVSLLQQFTKKVATIVSCCYHAQCIFHRTLIYLIQRKQHSHYVGIACA